MDCPYCFHGLLPADNHVYYGASFVVINEVKLALRRQTRQRKVVNLRLGLDKHHETQLVTVKISLSLR